MIWESCAPKELSSDSNCCEVTAAGCWHSRVVAEIDPEGHSSIVHTQKNCNLYIYIYISVCHTLVVPLSLTQVQALKSIIYIAIYILV